MRYRTKYAIIELELLEVVWGLEHVCLNVYSKPIDLLTDYQALEPQPPRNRSDKTYSARSTSRSVNVNHIAGERLALI